MVLQNSDILHFHLFSQYDFSVHGIYSRQGGISKGPYNSLNVSFGVGDDPADILANRQKIKETLQTNILVSSKQVHGTDILVLDKDFSDTNGKVATTLKGSNHNNQEPDDLYEGYDAFISNIPGLALMVQQADCQAVMLLDPQKKIIANIHCGWRGSVANIIGKTIETMKTRFNVCPADLIAGISPSLGPCCAEFIHFKKELPASFYQYQIRPTYFDFWRISRDQLHAAGVMKKHIEISSVCTACNAEWFSYRREKHTGRFCSIIGLA